jgi:spore coat-associated protein N
VQNDPRFTRNQKIALSAALFVLAASLIGLGAYANFTATTSGTQDVTAGTMTVELGGFGGTNRLSVAATNVAPGDTIQRSVDVKNTGSIDFSAVTLTSTAAPVNILSTNATNGLQVRIDRCSVPWTEGGASPAFTYACSGTTSAVLEGGTPGSSVAVLGTSRALNNLLLASNDVNHLRVTLTLPGTADDTYQGLTSTVTYQFNAAQRAATNR